MHSFLVNGEKDEGTFAFSLPGNKTVPFHAMELAQGKGADRIPSESSANRCMSGPQECCA